MGTEVDGYYVALPYHSAALRRIQDTSVLILLVQLGLQDQFQEHQLHCLIQLLQAQYFLWRKMITVRLMPRVSALWPTTRNVLIDQTWFMSAEV
jgi:hypothetical protein